MDTVTWIFATMGFIFAIMAYERTGKLRRRLAALEREVFGAERTAEDYPTDGKDDDDSAF